MSKVKGKKVLNTDNLLGAQFVLIENRHTKMRK